MPEYTIELIAVGCGDLFILFELPTNPEIPMDNLLSGILLEITMTLICWIIIICGLWQIGEIIWWLALKILG